MRVIETVEELEALNPMSVLLMTYRDLPGGAAIQKEDGSNNWLCVGEHLVLTSAKLPTLNTKFTLLYEGVPQATLDKVDQSAVAEMLQENSYA